VSQKSLAAPPLLSPLSGIFNPGTSPLPPYLLSTGYLLRKSKLTKSSPFSGTKKIDGYTIVGIEQTDVSLVLGKESSAGAGGKVGGSWKLPEKALLMLGSEREGIPAELLGEVDLCIEIEQRGKTRSLNVQTAAAVVCYEWNRQWRQSRA